MPRYKIKNDELVFLLFKGTPNDVLCVSAKGKNHIAIWLDACHAATKAEEMGGEMLAARFGVLLEKERKQDFAVIGTDGEVYVA